MAGVLPRVQALWTGNLEDPIGAGDIVAAAGRLAAKRIILADAAARRLAMRLSLNISADDLVLALKKDDVVSWLPRLAL